MFIFKEEKEDKKKLTPLEEKMQEEYKEEYDGWLNHHFTKKVAEQIKSDIEEIERRVLKCSLSSGVSKDVNSKQILAYSLQVRALKRVLGVFQKQT